MHVLHVIDSLGLGGAERMLVDIANATAADGQRVSVCVTRSESPLAKQLRPGIEVLVLGRRRRLSMRPAARLARWIRRNDVDVLHVHMRSSLAFMIALKSLFMLRTPIVFHDHYGSIELDTSVPRWFAVGHRLVAKYVGVSPALAQWARSAGMPADKVSMIPNALDLDRLTRAQPVGVPRTDAAIGILVASFKREKGIDVFIEALAQSKHRNRARVLVAGGGVDSEFGRECRARVEAYALGGAITFLGARDDVAGLLKSVDFALLTSHSESGPLVLVEYIANGLPIVSTRVGDIGKRLAAAGVPGFVEPRDPKAFTEALDELLDLDAGARAARGETGRKLLNAGWDIRHALPRWLEVYEQAIRSRF